MAGLAKRTKASSKRKPPKEAMKGALRVKTIYAPDHSREVKMPLFLEAVSAGFPSPAEDYLEGKMDLNEDLVKHPAATFFVRVTGDSMIESGIRNGDLLVVDRAVQPADDHVVIAVLNGELTVKRIRIEDGKILLVPENKAYKSIPVDPEMSFEIWGVVTHAIHSL
jgi:DNA polymerase V